MNYAQMRYAQDAAPGNEDAGYAEAIVGVDGEWGGIRVAALPEEMDVIDHEPTSRLQSSRSNIERDPSLSRRER